MARKPSLALPAQCRSDAPPKKQNFRPAQETAALFGKWRPGPQYNEEQERPDTGIDLFFTEKSHKLNKPVLELESTELQLNMFNDFSDSLQEKLLKDTLDSLAQADNETAETSIDLLSEMWIKGDEETLTALTKSSASEPEYYKALLSDRNIGMFNHVKEYLNSDTKSTYFVVVGALHMVGDDGVVTKLQKEGYTVVKQ
ncbi:TraB/GumN family protein [Paenibacillus albidus]|uniref:TraB/GumN family protein n=1 Tax=Paenibacillus albidus TaxID=2041023 RepID=UPI001BE6A8AE|nr:TraB/GumN family protein [Paenibacillus albidus]MBT2288693.1 TraB/GumN family protein [Paenibacillus albidus]